MQQSQAPVEDLKHFGFRDVAVVVLSLLVLVGIGIQSFIKLEPAVATLLDRIDFFICIFFLLDFGVRLRNAPSKRAYLRWGWIDLISSIPVWDPLRWGRAVRLVRILRVLRAFRSARHLLRLLYRETAKATIATAALAVTVLVIVAAVSILIVENEPNSSIKNPFDALWWAVTTVTTVGYGDQVPVTIEGRLIAMVLMIAGIALFGVFTGLFARLLISSEETNEDRSAVLQELRLLREKIEKLERPDCSADMPQHSTPRHLSAEHLVALSANSEKPAPRE